MLQRAGVTAAVAGLLVAAALCAAAAGTSTRTGAATAAAVSATKAAEAASVAHGRLPTPAVLRQLNRRLAAQALEGFEAELELDEFSSDKYFSAASLDEMTDEEHDAIPRRCNCLALVLRPRAEGGHVGATGAKCARGSTGRLSTFSSFWWRRASRQLRSSQRCARRHDRSRRRTLWTWFSARRGTRWRAAPCSLLRAPTISARWVAFSINLAIRRGSLRSATSTFWARGARR